MSARSQPTVKRWGALTAFSTWLFGLYLAIVLPVEVAVPQLLNWRVAVPLMIGSFVATYLAVTFSIPHLKNANETFKSVSVMMVVLVVSFIGIDVAYTAYSNSNADFRIDQERLWQTRHSDQHLWESELTPLGYTPTNRNFYVYKPNQVKRGSTYGEHYYPALEEHAVMRESVLRKIDIEFVIDEYGLRNTVSPEQAEVFVIGDSFSFGFHVTQSATFAERLSARIGTPVYNMGTTGSSPLQQFLLLSYMLERYPDKFRPSHLVWMIYEGNDLEESYNEHSAGGESRLQQIFGSTLIGEVFRIPEVIRQQSVLRLVTSGQMTFTERGQSGWNPYVLNGKTLAYPLYRSERFGYRIFRQLYIDRAVADASYVMEHPNLPKLKETFERMRALAQKAGFDVTVMLVPTGARLYHEYFEDFPAASPRPYFLDQVKLMAGGAGFDIVDLHALLAPYAARELLYATDDTHWTARGHDVAAALVGRHLLQQKADLRNSAPGVSAAR